MTGISFLSPAFLVALAAIALPIVIHLISRRRAIRWPWAAMDFLLRSHRKIIRRLQLKQILLLLLRCLLLAILALAFAKPFLKRAQGSSPATPAGIVFIIDDSMSMGWQDAPQKESLFQRAKKKAQASLRALRGEDQVALLRGSQTIRREGGEQTELTFDKQAVSRLLDTWVLSFRATNLTSAIREAHLILRDKPGIRPQIVVFSDLARHAFPDSKNPQDAPIPVLFVPIRPSRPPHNVAILDVTVAPAPLSSSDAYQVTVTVRNFSSDPIPSLPITIALHDKPRLKGFLSLGPQRIGQKQFLLQLPQAGVYQAWAEVSSPKDGLAADDRFYFVLQARKLPRILLFNGDPRSVSYLDETYYLERALLDPSSPFRLTIKSISSETFPSLQEYDLVIFANVAKIPFAWGESLQRFIEAGGGLWITCGEQVDADSYNASLAALLPRPLRGMALAAQRTDGTGLAVMQSFGEIQASHPIFRQLDRDGIIFQTARASKLMLVETSQKKEEGSILWRFSHGPPALLERAVGKGRVLLFTTSIDRDWTDLPIRPFFQPWVAQIVTHLTGGARFLQGQPLLVDQTRRLAAQGSEPFQIQPPKGDALLIRPQGSTFAFPPSSTPGFYRFLRDGRPLEILPQAVNLDPRESDLTPFADKEIQRLGVLQSSSKAEAFHASERLWPFLLLFLLLLFLSESLILRFL